MRQRKERWMNTRVDRQDDGETQEHREAGKWERKRLHFVVQTISFGHRPNH